MIIIPLIWLICDWHNGMGTSLHEGKETPSRSCVIIVRLRIVYLEKVSISVSRPTDSQLASTIVVVIDCMY